MIIWRSQDSEWRRYVDYFFMALVVVLVGVGVYGFLNWGDDGTDVETIPSLPIGLVPTAGATSTTQRTLPPALTLPPEETTTTRKRATTTVAVATTVAATTAASTTVPPVTVAPTIPPPTTSPPPADTSGPTIGGTLRTSPAKVYETPCTDQVTFTIEVSDASGVASVSLQGNAMSRVAGSNQWTVTRSSWTGVVGAGQASFTQSMQVVAFDNRLNRRTVNRSVVIYDCA